MNVILLDNLKNLGKLGDTIVVKPGYARNYLLPQGKAVRASKDNIAYFESKKEEFAKKIAEKAKQTQSRAEKIEGLNITVTCRSSDEGKLYGSIGGQEIVKAITDQGHEVTKKEVMLPLGPFREIGEYEVQISLDNGDSTALVKLTIIAEKD